MSLTDRLDYWKRRARDAERRLEFADEYNESTRQWAIRAFDEQRRLGDRLTFVYGVAIAHGATHDELKQPESKDAT